MDASINLEPYALAPKPMPPASDSLPTQAGNASGGALSNIRYPNSDAMPPASVSLLHTGAHCIRRRDCCTKAGHVTSSSSA